MLKAMKSAWRDLSPIQYSCNCNYSLLMHNKTPVHSTWGLVTVCAACSTPCLNLISVPRPSWVQHPRYVPQRVRNGYNWTRSEQSTQEQDSDLDITVTETEHQTRKTGNRCKRFSCALCVQFNTVIVCCVLSGYSRA